jgi:hypothetical protein
LWQAASHRASQLRDTAWMAPRAGQGGVLTVTVPKP